MKHMDLYMEIMYSKSELSRAEREMIAVVVSLANGCEYCQIHHAEALAFYWKDKEKIAQLKQNFRVANLSDREYKLCLYSEMLTKQPHDCKENDPTKELKEIGFSDSAILDATLVTAYFNFVNRMVLALGVDLEEDSGKGFNY